MKNKEIATKSNWIRERNKSKKKTIKTEESKLELLREIIKKSSENWIQREN